MTRPGGHVGITCQPDHHVFSLVGAALVERGHAVTYIDPTGPTDHRLIESFSVFANKRTRPASVRALLHAERNGVRTWNSAMGVMACVSRLSQLCALAGVGFDVPAVSLSKPDGEYVAKSRYHWGGPPSVNGEGDIYEELLPADSVDHKYYAVDTGSGLRIVVVRATSKLHGEKRILGRAEPIPEHVEGLRTLMERLGMRAVGVDFVAVNGDWYAVDMNPCPGFRGTGLADALADSIESCLR